MHHFARSLYLMVLLFLLIAIGKAAGPAVAGGYHPAVASQGNMDYFVYLPLVHKAPNACEAIPGVSYSYLGVEPGQGYEPGKPPPENNPDYNLLLLGYDWVDEYKGLVFYEGGFDSNAPQFYTMFTDQRTPAFVNTYRAHGWDWENHRPLPPPEPNPPSSWPVTVLGVGVTPKEIILTPDSGYDIQYGYDAMVLYATEQQITLTYTRHDHIRVGYTIYIAGICVEPSLRALYNQLNAAGRHDLPVLRGGQPLGRAWGGEVNIAIRDNATFGDPRSCKDHWQGRCP